MKIAFNILYTKFSSISFSTQPHQSEANNNKRDKTKSCKHQSNGGTLVNETDKYIVSFFFDDKDLQLSLLS